MSEQFNPKPTRLLIPTADELSPAIQHFEPYPLPEGSERLAEIQACGGGRVASDEVVALRTVQEALLAASTPEEAAELGEFFAAVAYGGCKYLLAEPAAQPAQDDSLPKPKQRQNRYGTVPMLANPMPHNRPGTEQLRDHAVQVLDVAIHVGRGRFATTTRPASANQRNASNLFTGRLLFETASHLAVIGMGDTTADPGNYIGDNEAQLFSRDACMRAMNIADDLSAETGFHTSLIQAASLISPDAVEQQRAASPRAVRLFTSALGAVFDQTVSSFSTKNGFPVS